MTIEADNIINHPRGTIIMNGGNPLKDCPTDWDKATEWEKEANKESEGEWERPMWNWDCGFKLDYDGPLVRISSRFFPPKTHYGDTWDGNVTVIINDDEIHEEKFDCKTLGELKLKVEEYVNGLQNEIKEILTKILKK